MSQHTPGPWVWSGKVLDSAHGRIFDHAKYEGMWFAAYDDERDKANAHLIAAAPDLLASLVEMEEMLHGWMQDNTGLRELDVLERCESAIAKAKGKS